MTISDDQVDTADSRSSDIIINDVSSNIISSNYMKHIFKDELNLHYSTPWKLIQIESRSFNRIVSAMPEEMEASFAENVLGILSIFAM